MKDTKCPWYKNPVMFSQTRILQTLRNLILWGVDHCPDAGWKGKLRWAKMQRMWSNKLWMQSLWRLWSYIWRLSQLSLLKCKQWTRTVWVWSSTCSQWAGNWSTFWLLRTKASLRPILCIYMLCTVCFTSELVHCCTPFLWNRSLDLVGQLTTSELQSMPPCLCVKRIDGHCWTMIKQNIKMFNCWSAECHLNSELGIHQMNFCNVQTSVLFSNDLFSFRNVLFCSGACIAVAPGEGLTAGNVFEVFWCRRASCDSSLPKKFLPGKTNKYTLSLNRSLPSLWLDMCRSRQQGIPK